MFLRGIDSPFSEGIQEIYKKRRRSLNKKPLDAKSDSSLPSSGNIHTK